MTLLILLRGMSGNEEAGGEAKRSGVMCDVVLVEPACPALHKQQQRRDESSVRELVRSYQRSQQQAHEHGQEEQDQAGAVAAANAPSVGFKKTKTRQTKKETGGKK